MSGASGKVPAAIHVSPEAFDGGPLGRLRDGDVVRVDGERGELLVADEDALARGVDLPDLSENAHGCGRELFAALRAHAGPAERGASVF